MMTGAFTRGGAVQAAKGVAYIERKADQDLIGLCASGTFAYVLAPRQMGKSSLMIHTVQRLRQRGVACVTIILTAKDVTADQWYRAMLIRIADQLRLRIDPQRWWADNNNLSASQRFKQFLQEVLPAETTQRVVIFIDEIELTLGLDFADDFFGVLRSIYDERASIPALERISFVLLGATSPGELVKQPTRAPFNIGRPVEMTDFTFEEAQQFAQWLSDSLKDAMRVLVYILEWTGGQPYLTQCLCAALLEHRGNWDRKGIEQLAHSTFFRSREAYNSNLQEVQRTITKRAEDPYAALTAYRTILRRGSLPDSAQSSAKAVLKLSGIVRSNGGRLVVRNRIYRTVFDKAWVQEQLELLPNYLPRRIQRTVQLAAYVLVLPLIVLAIVAGFQWYRANQASLGQQASAAQAQTAAAKAQTAAAQQQQAAATASGAEATALIAQRGAETAAALLDVQKQAAESAALALHAVARLKDDRDFSLKVLASAAKRGWTPAVDQAMRQIMPPPCVDLNHHVYDAIWSSNGTTTLLVDADATAPLSSTLSLIPMPPGVGGSGYLSPDGSMLLVANSDGTAEVQGASGNLVATLPSAGAEIKRAIWSSDNRWIITITTRGAARLWDATNGTNSQILDGQDGVNSAAWSGDGQRFVLAYTDDSLRLWSLDPGKSPAELGRSLGWVSDLAWSPDNSQLAVATTNGTVQIWDVHKRVQARIVHTHDGPVLGLRWSQDQKHILTVDDDWTVRVWDAAHGGRISAIRMEREMLPFAAAQWSADNGHMLVAGIGGRVCTYAMPEQMQDLLKAVTPLSIEEENRLFAELLPTPIQPTNTEEVATPSTSPGNSVPIPGDNEPTAVTDVPTAVTEVPTAVTVGPTAVTDVPTAITVGPTAVTDVPTAITVGPTAVTDVPTAVTDVPTAVTIGPTAVTDVPTAVTGELKTLTDIPTAVTVEPTAVTPIPNDGINAPDKETAAPLGETSTTVDSTGSNTSLASPTPEAQNTEPTSTPTP